MEKRWCFPSSIPNVLGQLGKGAELKVGMMKQNVVRKQPPIRLHSWDGTLEGCQGDVQKFIYICPLFFCVLDRVVAQRQ